jgi:hypothetical protein
MLAIATGISFEANDFMINPSSVLVFPFNVACTAKFRGRDRALAKDGGAAAAAFSGVRRDVREAPDRWFSPSCCVIARRTFERYSLAVRSFFWQRLALIFLLMGRLVIGELGHAMPMSHASHSAQMSMAGHHPMSADTTSPAMDHAACPDHEGKQHAPAADHATDVAHGNSSHSTGDPSSGDKDCCKSSGCECPCLHVPCVALDESMPGPVAMTMLLFPQGAEGLDLQRSSGLFRPPA